MTTARRTTWGVAVAALTALAMAPMASAYEPPSNPGKVNSPSGKSKKTFNVCQSPSSKVNDVKAKTSTSYCFSTIQKAVEYAGSLNASRHKYISTINVSPGTYREFVLAQGHKFDGLTIQGTSSNAASVKIDLATLSSTPIASGPYAGITPTDNALTIDSAVGVTVKNLTVTNYKGNGVWIVRSGVPESYWRQLETANTVLEPKAALPRAESFGTKTVTVGGTKYTYANTFTVDNVVASFGGVYGIFARTSAGGAFINSEAYYNNDSAFYIGETPRQTSPSRTYIVGVKMWGNELGYSGTNSRYVTITKSRVFNNGMGIVPNITMGENWPPPSENQYTDNDIYGNNFNYFKGAPFSLNNGGLGGGAAYPPGIGVLLFGSQKTDVSKNRIWGNKLAGVAMIDPGILIKDSNNWKKICPVAPAVAPSAADCTALKESAIPKYNKIFGNSMGWFRPTTSSTYVNRNGRDIVIANDGVGNCVGGTGTYANTPPAGQPLLEIGKTLPNVKPTTNQWQVCNPTGTPKYSITMPGKMTEAYYWMLSFADDSASSGSEQGGGLGAVDPKGQDYVDNRDHEGRWHVHGSPAAWPSAFGKPLETCVVTAPFKGCDGQAGGKP